MKRIFRDANRTAKRIEKTSIPEPNSGCWLWLGMVDKAGYGKTSYGKGKTLSASRLSYIAHKCDPGDSIIRHTCDVRLCVNPDHLVSGTQKENIHDMFNRGRARPRGKAVSGLLDSKRASPNSGQEHAVG